MKRSYSTIWCALLSSIALITLTSCGTPRMAMEGNMMPEEQVARNLYIKSPHSAYDVPPKFKRGFAPYFPDDQVAKRQWGYANTEFTIGTDGRVDDIKIVTATAFGFAKEAFLCLQDYKFIPAQKNGQPVAVRARLPFTFRLSH